MRAATGGGSDANAFRLDGFDCVLLANGTEANHTAEERVSAANLETMLEVCEGIVAARERDGRHGRGAGADGVSGRLELRRGVVVAAEPLTVEIDGERRPAWADTALLGEMREGDEVVVNVAALDLGLGSGGFDVVHVNLTRGLDGGAAGRRARDQAQLHLPPAPGRAGRGAGRPGRTDSGAREAVPVSGPAAARAPGARGLGGGAGFAGDRGSATCRRRAGRCPGSLSRDVAELRERGLLCGSRHRRSRLRR